MPRLLRRTILFVPANNQRMAEKASKVSADMIILDCEDSVPRKEKLAARHLSSQSLRRHDWGLKEVGIRINGLDTPFWLGDLKSAIESSANFVVVPKVEDLSQVKMVDEVIRYPAGTTRNGRVVERERYEDSKREEEKKKLPRIVVAIENARGLVNIERILSSSNLITAVEFGAEDYSLSLGIL